LCTTLRLHGKRGTNRLLTQHQLRGHILHGPVHEGGWCLRVKHNNQVRGYPACMFAVYIPGHLLGAFKCLCHINGSL
jgi:hypothetical protein